MQGDIEREVYGNFVQTAKKIGSDSGFTGFYRGATFRYGRMVRFQLLDAFQPMAWKLTLFDCFDCNVLLCYCQVCAVFLMDLMREKIGRLMYPQAFEK
jgi:hypothetical protein